MARSLKNIGVTTSLFVTCLLLSGCQYNSSAQREADKSFARSLEEQHQKDIKDTGKDVEKALEHDKRLEKELDHGY